MMQSISKQATCSCTAPLPSEIALLYEGQAVSFDIETARRGLRAVNIAVVG
jgi:hypothetical protein